MDLSWASSRLEGNTYSRLDTQNLIEHGLAAQGKDAIEMLIENMDEVGFDAFTFKSLKAGETARYCADRPHAIRNVGKTAATAWLVVVHPA